MEKWKEIKILEELSQVHNFLNIRAIRGFPMVRRFPAAIRLLMKQMQ